MTLAKFGVKAFSIFVLLASVATTAEARKVQMAVATFSQSVLPMVVAQEKGYFREDDLDVELILMTASAEPGPDASEIEKSQANWMMPG